MNEHDRTVLLTMAARLREDVAKRAAEAEKCCPDCVERAAKRNSWYLEGAKEIEEKCAAGEDEEVWSALMTAKAHLFTALGD